MPSFSAKPRRIVILAFPGALLLDIAGPAQVFWSAGGYEIVTASLAGGLVLTDTGITLDTRPCAEAGVIDTLIIPGGTTTLDELHNAALLDWIRQTSACARRTASVCMGAFLLAAAGLLQGRRAATHWRYCDALRAQFPGVIVEDEPIFVRDGDVWSSAGVSAGIDLALALVEEDLGHAAALEVAQRLVVFLKRPGGQRQFSRALATQSADPAGRFAVLHGWISDNLSADLRVEALAERAGMSPRSFARLYAAHTGETPARAVEALRLEAAQRMLTEQPGVNIASIAQRCGFGDDERMRRAFIRAVGVPPTDYRERFGGRGTQDGAK